MCLQSVLLLRERQDSNQFCSISFDTLRRDWFSDPTFFEIGKIILQVGHFMDTLRRVVSMCKIGGGGGGDSGEGKNFVEFIREFPPNGRSK